MAFKRALQESNIPIFVQVMPWDRIPESFRQNILKQYDVLYVVEKGVDLNTDLKV